MVAVVVCVDVVHVDDDDHHHDNNNDDHDRDDDDDYVVICDGGGTDACSYAEYERGFSRRN